MKTRIPIMTALLIGLLSLAALAQGNIPYQRLLVLVAGPSGDRIHPNEQAVVSHLNQMRGQYNFSQLQMGTMHFDRASEASLLRNQLGFSSQAGVTVGLVQLSDQGLPMRTLYKMERVTPSSLAVAQDQLLQKWSRYSGEYLPAGLQAKVSPPPPPPPTAPPPANDPWVTTTEPPADEPPAEVLSFEGIRSVVGELHRRSGGIWNNLKNAPLREDGKDREVRRQTLGLTEAANNLYRANQEGVIYPVAQLRQVLNAGQAWEAAEPQYYLPVSLRQEVEPMRRLLKQVRDIERQSARG